MNKDNKLNWELMYDKQPKPGCRFIALFNDGSGSQMFIRVGDKVCTPTDCKEDNDWYDLEYLDNFLYWYPLPEGFKFWGEGDQSIRSKFEKEITPKFMEVKIDPDGTCEFVNSKNTKV